MFDPAFDPTRESTYKFIDTFIGEMVKIFPDAYWHIGGDENNGKQWGANPEIQAFMKKRGMKDAHALQTHFNQRLLAILKKHDKRMMGWDEIFQPGLPKETVVHSWRGQKSLFDAAKQGYDGVLSAGYYIDLLETAARHYAVDPLPANSGLTDAEAAHILGGEATMWGEWVGTGDGRIAHLAAQCGDRGALLVAARGEQRRRHVPPARAREHPARGAGPAARAQRRHVVAPAGRRAGTSRR